MKYEIAVTRTETCFITVDAANEEDAKNAAYDEAIESYDAQVWETDNIETNVTANKGDSYGYYINLDEREEFYADVRDGKGDTVYEIKGFDIFEDGFMRDKKDMTGLLEYLIHMQIVEPESEITYIG